MKRLRTALLLLGMVGIASPALAQVEKNQGTQTEILWDTWGVPHIFSQDEVGAFRAFGWAQMYSHGNLLLKLIAQGRGRAAEYYGEEYAGSDRNVRTLGIYERARTWYSEQNPQFRAKIDAFAEGINQYAKENPVSLEAQAQSVLPVTGVDILSHTTRVMSDFLFAGFTSGCDAALPETPAFGSNGWAIAPSHSVSGHAMLLANPHLPWNGEYTFYEAQVATPSYEAYGTTLVGFPVLVIAFNDTHGWSHTVNTIDACDIYALRRDGDGYTFDGARHAFETETQLLKIRQHDGSMKEEHLVLRRSLLGPVVEKEGKLLAIRAAGFQVGSYPGVLEQWWEMGRARNFAEFQAALKRMQLPMLNVVYADRDGHIELLYDGFVPVRPSGDANFWRGAVLGDTSSLVWNKLLSFDELPKVIDPPAGWVQNSNSGPWYMTEPFLNPDRFPPYLSANWNDRSGAISGREQRGLHMLTHDAKLSFDQMLADKYSTHSDIADRLLPDLIAAARQSGDEAAPRAAVILEQWDREFNANSRGALLFVQWINLLAERTHGDYFAQHFDPRQPLDTPRGLRDTKASVTALVDAAAQVQNLAGRADVAWGEVNRLRRGKFDLPGDGAPDMLGAYGVFRVIIYAPQKDGRLGSVFGDTFVAAVEFSSPLRAKVLMTYGNSSNPESPHFGDQLPLTANKEWREPWRTRAEIEQHLEMHTVFGSGGSVTTTVQKPH